MQGSPLSFGFDFPMMKGQEWYQPMNGENLNKLKEFWISGGRRYFQL